MKTSTGKISLYEYNKEVAEEWHPDKNGTLTPHDVPPKSHKKVWWICKKGHEWQATITHRNNGTGCPYCSGKKICIDNCLATLNSSLANEWNYEKNGSLTPNDVTLSSGKKVWWECKKGHVWEASINNRSAGKGCPYCAGKKLSPENSLLSLNPELANEWNFKKNKNLKPDSVTVGSSKKVWWICNKGHEWQARISHRNNGSGCPYCSGRKVCEDNSLATLNLLLAEEWNFEKNGTLTPKDVSARSGRKVWWKCMNGHEWKADVYNRSKGIGCPYCSGRNPTPKTSLAYLNPNLTDEWNYNRNSPLTPNDVTSKSGKKVWWTCMNSHDWQAVISDRANGNGCPSCAKEMKSSFPEQAIYYYIKKHFPKALNTYFHVSNNKKHEIDIFIPDILLGIEYDGVVFHSNAKRIKNDELKNKVFSDNNIKLIRVREKGCPAINMHGQKHIECENSRAKSTDQFLSNAISEIFNFINNEYNFDIKVNIDIKHDRNSIFEQYIHLKKENSLDKLNPKLADEWNYKKNKKITPDKVTISSGKKVWWLCKEGHEWQATIASRSSGNNCPYCSGRFVTLDNNLAVVNPALAKEWNYKQNDSLSPNDITAKSGKKVWWLCKNGHEWLATVNSRSSGRGCPYCANKIVTQENCLATTNPELAFEWNSENNRNLTPNDVSSGSSKKVWWICKKGHEWKAAISDRSNGNNCPYCQGRYASNEYNLSIDNPDLAKEWNHEKNDGLLPSQVTPKSHEKVWWKCKRGHEWQASIAHRSNGTGCPTCWRERKNEN